MILLIPTLSFAESTGPGPSPKYLTGSIVFKADCTFSEESSVSVSTDAKDPLTVFAYGATATKAAGVGLCVLTVDEKAPTDGSFSGVGMTADAVWGPKASSKDGKVSDLKTAVAAANTLKKTDASDPPKAEPKHKLSELTEVARAMYTKEKYGDLGAHTIVVLPDGTTIPELLPTDIDENDDVQFILLYPKNGEATLVPSCTAAPNQVRILDTYADITDMISPQAGGEKTDTTLADAQPLAVHVVKARCATKIDVKVAVTAPGFTSAATAFELAVDNLYRFSWGVGLGFDFGTRVSGMELETEATTDAAGQETTSTYVGGTSGMSGPTALVLLNVHLAGYSKEYLTIKERPFSAVAITAGIDPTRLKGGLLGATFIPLPGFGITAGASYFPTQVAQDGAGNTFAVGSAWTTDRDLIAVDDWGVQALGVWVGLNLTGDLRESISSLKSGSATSGATKKAESTPTTPASRVATGDLR